MSKQRSHEKKRDVAVPFRRTDFGGTVVVVVIADPVDMDIVGFDGESRMSDR